MPSTVTVPAGSTSATWTIVTKDVGSTTTIATISASANGGAKTANLTVKPNTPTAFSFTPATVTGGGSSTGKVTFGRALAADTPVSLTVLAGASAVSSMPSSVTAPAGSTSVAFTLVSAPVSAQTSVQVSATANGGSKTGTLTVK
jgi:hypothetical protein